jgi:ferredoxin-nitrite reductase
VAAAAVRVFLKHGDRTNRRRARLKYLLDEWGFDRFIAEVERQLGHPLARAAVDEWQTPEPPNRWAHVGIQQQKQDGRCYVGVVLPVGRMTTTQLRGLVRIADRYGSGAVRLTVWQNLLIPDVRAEDLDVVTRELEAIDLDWKASSVRAGLVACTGKAGCKYAAADTKRHALQRANHIEQRLDLDVPVNVHVTGCHHSCAQHYIGDIGLQSTQVEVGDDVVEGYHLSVGGGFADQQAIGRTLFHSLPFAEVPATVERLLGFYLDQRFGPSESFADFTRRFELDELRDAIMGYALV